jgi:hypothetical protein
MMGLLKKDLYYIYAEFNPFWAYMGWWLYAIPVNELTDEQDIKKWVQAEWLNYDWRLEALFRDLELPDYGEFHASDPTWKVKPNQYWYCRAFFLKYPAGVVCEVREDGRKFIERKAKKLGDYQRIVRERQLLHIAKAAEERER